MTTIQKISAFLLLSVFWALPASSANPALQAELNTSHRYLQAEKTQTIPLKIGLTGGKLITSVRPVANVAIVIDRSGSMAGQKLQKAKDSAIAALSMLSRDDIVSVITYSYTTQVVVPATKVRDRDSIANAIRNIRSGGNTALYAGVAKGAGELKKFLETNQVNRVVLLSDGLANVGPSTPHALGQLGSSLARDGISVSTIGLGIDYNEDLMARLALNSEGNHVFAEEATDLASLFQKEFGSILSVVAQDVDVRIRVADGVRPIRVLGRDAEIRGNDVVLNINQLYSGHEKYVMLEVEVPAREEGSIMKLASASISFQDLNAKTKQSFRKDVTVSFTSSKSLINENVNKSTLRDYYIQTANLANREAIRLRDMGQKEAAKKVLSSNVSRLESTAQAYDIPELQKQADWYGKNEKLMDKKNWKAQRKSFRAFDNFNTSQGAYQGK